MTRTTPGSRLPHRHAQPSRRRNAWDIPELTKQADAAAKAMLGDLFPGREIVMLDIDALAAGGGGIHCATQQQPRIA